jgi:hypothetical protein
MVNRAFLLYIGQRHADSTTRVPYAALVSTFEKIEATTKRLEILEILTQFFLVVVKRDISTTAKDSNLLKVVYLCINRVGSFSVAPVSIILYAPRHIAYLPCGYVPTIWESN